RISLPWRTLLFILLQQRSSRRCRGRQPSSAERPDGPGSIAAHLRTVRYNRSGCGFHLRLAFENAHDVALFHDQQLLAVDLDLGAGPLAEEHRIAGLHVERHELALLVAGAGPDG